jgi:capsular exopolysaccharide synthesis family protein
MSANNNEFNLKSLVPNASDDYDDLLSEIDIAKLLVVARKSIIWILLFFFISIVGAFLFYRYTKPVYQSSSILKLDLKSDAGVLGFRNFKDETVQQATKLTTISGEIELIKSRLIYEKVIDKMNLYVSYYSYGKILYDEKYKDSPFVLKEYEIKNPAFYNTPIDVLILSQDSYVLTYREGKNETSKKYKFNEWVENEHFRCKIALTNYFSPQNNINQHMFFVVNGKEDLINYISENITVEILNLDANTIKVSFKDHNKFKAADVVNAIDSVYLQQTIESKSKAHDQTIKFLEASLKRTEIDLSEAEKNLETFVRNNKTVDVKMDFIKMTQKMEEIDQKKLDLRIKIALLNDVAELISINRDLKVFLPSLYQIPDPQLTAAITALNQLQQERELMKSSYNDNTQVLRTKDKSIENLKKNIFELVSLNKKLLFEQLNELNKALYEIERNSLQMPSKETEYTRLKRFYSLYEKFYLLLMEKEAEFGIAKAGTIPNFVILSPGLINHAHIYPKKSILYLIGTGLGIFLSIAFVFFRYFLHDTISTLKEMEKGLQVPMVGGIPMYTKEKLEVSKLIVDKNPKSQISEAIRSIRTNLEFICPNKKKKLITVTSTVSGEGKTFIAVNLGAVISMSNQKVIVVDLDMRKPKVHYAFDSENFKGMSTVLIGKHSVKECINQSTLDNLSYITAGPTPPNPSELILRKEFEDTIHQLFEDFDVVVIDTPPVGLVTDGILIMKSADIALYVVRADYSKKVVKKNINKVARTLGSGKVSVILNAVKGIHTYGYGAYGYGYGYGYGYYDGDSQKKSFFKKIFSRK